MSRGRQAARGDRPQMPSICEASKLFALEVERNVVTRTLLVPAAEGTDDDGYRSPEWERQSRAERIAARRARFEAAIAEDLGRTG